MMLTFLSQHNQRGAEDSMPRKTRYSRAKEGRMKLPRKIKNLTYEEAHYAVMSALSCERNYPMDSASRNAMSQEADGWLRRAHEFHSNKFDRSIYDPEEILYGIYRTLRLDAEWIETVPRAKARWLWDHVWKYGLKEEPVNRKYNKMSSREQKWWRADFRERAKDRFEYEAANGTLLADMRPAVQAFYRSTDDERVFPLNIRIIE
jgi:hypothetical protein